MRKQRQDHLLRKEPQGYKEYKYLYREMLKEDVIRKAYKKLRKGKPKEKRYSTSMHILMRKCRRCTT